MHRVRWSFAADFYLLKPVDMAQGNRRLIVDCVNRGRKVILGMLNSAPRVPDPSTAEEFGNGFLMRHGYTIAWVGWQTDVPRHDGLMALDAPRAQGVAGFLRCEMRPNKRVQTLPLADRYHIPNPTLDVEDREARLLMKAHAGAAAVEIPRSAWRFSDPGHIELAEGFTPGAIYDVIYRSADPPVVGLGFLAVRDCGAYLRWAADGVNPCSGTVERAYLFGVSQTGRFLRHLLHLGSTRRSRQAGYDGVIPHIAGARRGEFNLRFGQPSLNAKGAVGSCRPSTTGRSLRASASGQPAEDLSHQLLGGILRGDASLITPIPRARGISTLAFVRIYLLAGTQHTRRLPPLEADPNTGDRGEQRFNVVDYAPLMRAALVNLDRWVTDAVEPPASASRASLTARP